MNRLLCVICCLAISITALAATNCQKLRTLHKHVLNKPYPIFDQQRFRGWRVFANEGCYAMADELIQRYLVEHSELTPWQKANLNFHSGQMRAMQGDKRLAVHALRQALLKPQPATRITDWNAYVRATIAYIEGDINSVRHYRQRMRNHVKEGYADPNLVIVNKMISNSNAKYADLYTDAGKIRPYF